MSVKQILLIEDNISDVGLTKRALEKARVDGELVVAEDGQEALDLLLPGNDPARVNPPLLPVLTLLDLKLPKVSGLEVLRRIKANPRTRRLPVVILTTSTEERDIVATYDLGVNSYIHKPVDFKQFAQNLQQLAAYWLGLNQPPPEAR